MLNRPVTGVDQLRLHSRARSNLRPVLIGQSVSLFGDYIAYFTLPFFMVELTGRAFDLGLVAAAETVPMLAFGLAAGVILDRVVLRRALVTADLVRGAVFLALSAAIATKAAQPWMVFAVAFTVGTMAVVFDSGLQALLPSVLTEDMLLGANSKLQLARTLALTFSPAAAGLIIARFGGFQMAFLIDGLTFWASAAYLMRLRELAVPDESAGATFLGELADGIVHLWREVRLRWATIGAGVTNLVFAPLEATLFLYARDELGLGAEGAGWFFAVHALLGAAGVAFAPRAARRMPLGQMFVVGMVMLGGGYVVVSYSHDFVAVIPAGIGLAGVTWINVALTTLRQTLTPRPVLGRVVAASRTIGWLGLPLGAVVGGYLGDVIGLRTLFRAGSGALVVGAAVLILTPLWRRTQPAEEA